MTAMSTPLPMQQTQLAQQAQQALRSICQQARLAPSVHNTQPWHFRTTPDSFVLMTDRTRQLRSLDPTGRQLLVSAGCALFNARVAAAAAGLTTEVTRFPEGGSSDVVATMRITGRRPDDVLDELASLDPLIAVRSTNRRRFADDPVPSELIATLRRGAEREDSRLVQIVDETDRVTVARLSQRADALQYQDAAYRAELRTWTTTDATRLDGVPARAVPHVHAGSGDEIPIRDFDSTGAGWLPVDTRSTRNQCLLLLGSDADEPAAWLRSGEALERILLEIARSGFAVSPLTQVVEVPSAREALRNELRLMMHPHVLLRIGRASATPGTSRRHLDDLLVS